VLSELRLFWHAAGPSGSARNVSVGYNLVVGEVTIATSANGSAHAVRILAQDEHGVRHEFLFRTPGGLEELENIREAVAESVEAYRWAQRYLQVSLRQWDLFVLSCSQPELDTLPLEQVEEVFEGILNFGAAKAEDLVGHLIVTNCRLVWALNKDPATYNVSMPHRAYTPGLKESEVFGLCLVLCVPGCYVSRGAHTGGMRLGFGLMRGEAPKSARERLESIFARIRLAQTQFLAQPIYGVADYMENKRRYQVEARVRQLRCVSHWDKVSDSTRHPELELVGEVAECAICLEQVCYHPPQAYLLATGRIGRACRHFFHLQCVQRLSRRRCPVCRENYSEARELPDIRSSPGAWFDAMDSNRTGSLGRSEVLGALAVVLPLDREKLEAVISPSEGPDKSMHPDEPIAAKEQENLECCETPSTTSTESGMVESGTTRGSKKVDLWRQWDRAGTGRITQAEFENPEGGLLVWILDNLKRLHRQAQPAPSLLEAKEPEALGEWFDFWDWGQLGFLTQCQVARAVLKEFEDRAPWPQLGELVDRVWRRTTETSKEEAKSPTSLDNSPANALARSTPGGSEADGRSTPTSPLSSPMRSFGKLSLDSPPTPVPDPLHLAAGICARADFVDGLGMQLRDELHLELLSLEKMQDRFNFDATPVTDESKARSVEEMGGNSARRALDVRLEAKRYWLPETAKDTFHGPRCLGLALVPHPGDDSMSMLSARSNSKQTVGSKTLGDVDSDPISILKTANL
jgi:hypothetical protein